jgi:YHS domain-containing protein
MEPRSLTDYKAAIKEEMEKEKAKTEAKSTEEAPKVEAPKIEAPKIEPPKSESTKPEAPKGEAKADADKLDAEELAEVRKLPAAEQDAAIKQLVCPISDEHLGSMGVPVKVTAEGKTFYLCCKSCKKELDANPKAAIAKLAGK